MKVKSSSLTLICVGLTVLVLISIGRSYAKIDPESVVGAWLFDEGEGEIAKDSSGNGNDGEIKGKPKWVAGKFGTALELDGVSDYVAIPEFGNVAPMNDITITVWVKLKGVKNQDLFSFDPIVGDNRITIHFPWADAGNAIIFQDGTDQQYVVTTLRNETLNNWEHWAFVGSVSGGFMKIYRNGVEVAKTENKPAFRQSPQTWHIGGRKSYPFKGILDEVAVFNVALTEGDIENIMNKGLSRVLGITAVLPSGKLATSWGRVKTH